MKTARNHFLVGVILDALVRGTRLLQSRSGGRNPRVRHVRGFLGYALRTYEFLSPNIKAWLKKPTRIFPAILQVQTLNRCNAACPMCPYPTTIAREPREIMSRELWEKIVRECAAQPSLKVLVPMAQNEPLLDPMLNERIEFFRLHAQPEQQVELVTNGSMLDAARVDRLADSGVDLINVSVNSTDAPTYERVMPGLRWTKLMSNLLSISSSGSSRVNIFVRFVRQRDNAQQASSFRRDWQKAGFNVFVVEINDRSGTVKNFSALRNPDDWAGRFRYWFSKLFSRRIFPVCPYAFSIAYVLQNGDMPLCVNDWHHRELLGNVRAQSIGEIYNSPRAQAIRGLMKQGRYDQIAPCRTCSLWREATWI